MGESPPTAPPSPAVSQSMGRCQGWLQTAGDGLRAPARRTWVAPSRQRDLTVFHVCQVPEFLKLKRYDK